METENVLLRLMQIVTPGQVSSAFVGDVMSNGDQEDHTSKRREVRNGQSSGLHRHGMEYWATFPLRSPTDLQRWYMDQRDTHPQLTDEQSLHAGYLLAIGNDRGSLQVEDLSDARSGTEPAEMLMSEHQMPDTNMNDSVTVEVPNSQTNDTRDPFILDGRIRGQDAYDAMQMDQTDQISNRRMANVEYNGYNGYMVVQATRAQDTSLFIEQTQSSQISRLVEEDEFLW